MAPTKTERIRLRIPDHGRYAGPELFPHSGVLFKGRMSRRNRNRSSNAFTKT
jgi:hypothetical protein